MWLSTVQLLHTVGGTPLHGMSILGTCILQVNGLFKGQQREKTKDFQVHGLSYQSSSGGWLNSNSSTSKPSTLYEVGTIHAQLISLGTTSGKQTTNHMVYSIANLKITTQPFPLVRKNWSFCLFQEISFTCIG